VIYAGNISPYKLPGATGNASSSQNLYEGPDFFCKSNNVKVVTYLNQREKPTQKLCVTLPWKSGTGVLSKE